MAFDLLGVHMNSTGSSMKDIMEWKPPVVVTIDHSDAWHDFRKESPKTVVVGRLMGHYYDPGNLYIDPKIAARENCDAVLPYADRMGDSYDFWQGVNEPIVGSADAMKRLSDYDSERIRIMGNHGYRVVIGSFSVGNPHLSYWQFYLPALNAAMECNGALALHEYAWPTLYQDKDWYILRHRKVYDGNLEGSELDRWAGLPDHLKSLPLIITESALDRLITGMYGGWRVNFGGDPEKFMWQLDGYNSWLMHDKYVMGSAIYCADCGGEWATYNINPEILGMLKDRATPLYRMDRDIPQVAPLSFKWGEVIYNVDGEGEVPDPTMEYVLASIEAEATIKRVSKTEDRVRVILNRKV